MGISECRAIPIIRNIRNQQPNNEAQVFPFLGISKINGKVKLFTLPKALKLGPKLRVFTIYITQKYVLILVSPCYQFRWKIPNWSSLEDRKGLDVNERPPALPETRTLLRLVSVFLHGCLLQLVPSSVSFNPSPIDVSLSLSSNPLQNHNPHSYQTPDHPAYKLEGLPILMPVKGVGHCLDRIKSIDIVVVILSARSVELGMEGLHRIDWCVCHCRESRYEYLRHPGQPDR